MMIMMMIKWFHTLHDSHMLRNSAMPGSLTPNTKVRYIIIIITR